MSEVDPLFARPLFPVANEADAARTLAATLPYVRAAEGRATVLHVIEKAGGAPDKAPLEAREDLAEEIFDRAREAAADAGVGVETELRYGTDVADTIVAAADEIGATAIVFSPRGGRSWWDLFSGDVRETLTTESDVPVVVFPEAIEGEADEQAGGDRA
ncbi:MAG: universal stress protein [Haloquadratum sp.]